MATKFIDLGAAFKRSPKLRFYVITYEGGTGLQRFLLGLIIAGVLLACMFPVWPMWAKANLSRLSLVDCTRWACGISA